MGLSKRTLLFLVSGTLLVLAYVHEQVSVLQISYSIEKKEKQLHRLSEEHKLLKYQVARMHSPAFLNQQLKSRALNLSAPKAVQVMKMVRPKEMLPPLNQPATIKTAMSSWVGGFMREAQAKTSK